MGKKGCARDAHVALAALAAHRAVLEHHADEALTQPVRKRSASAGIDDDDAATLPLLAVDEVARRAELPQYGEQFMSAIDADRLKRHIGFAHLLLFLTDSVISNSATGSSPSFFGTRAVT